MPDSAATTPDPLSPFHPLVQAWFRAQVGVPTDIQAQAWPRIAAGRHVLLTAPTGSGKTLTAFLWALDRFARGASAPGATRVLYISPLKALNNDIRVNLTGPLEALAGCFNRAGESFPDIRAWVRSGDTPESERRRALRHPPEILITTPESLNLMLLSERGRDSLRQLETVILDEIHAVAGSKRGTHLITAVDRLAPLAGEFQRIALSATVRPLETVAAFIGGFALDADGYHPRPVEILASRTPKRYQLHVSYPAAEPAPEAAEAARAPADAAGSRIPQNPAADAPAAGGTPGEEDEVWTRVVGAIKRLLASARSTLIFANNRRLAERLARLLNNDAAAPIAFAHHGSLSREIRAVVETRMKQGLLPAIVATNSLELGIDVGALDQVIMVQTPFSIASFLQKAGRAGHGVGQPSRATVLASHARDALDAAVAVRCALDGDIEGVVPVDAPLDVLAQVLLSMASEGERNVEAMFAAVKASYPYRNLSRDAFDAVMAMLAGRFESARLRELRPRLSVDALDGTVRAGKGAALSLALGGGTIPDRGYYALRHAESRARIGELDEEFVWERRVGEAFTLGSQSWRIVKIGSNEVEVTPALRDAQMPPFWRAEERDRGHHFARRLGEFLERAEPELGRPDRERELSRALMDRHGLDGPAAAAVVSLLRRQREALGGLPHRHQVLIEQVRPGADIQAPQPGHRHVIVHAVWGGRVNRPFALALSAAYEARFGAPLDIIPGDDGLLLSLPEDADAFALFDAVRSDNLESLLRRSLERTGYFAAHFRECAGRALLLPLSTARARVPLWLSRLRSQSLLEAVAPLPDFPLILETWRECLRDEFDLPALKALLDEAQDGSLRVRVANTAEPSPFAEGLMWRRTNRSVYLRDKPAAGPAGARADLLHEIAFSSPLRPRLPADLIAEFAAKAQRRLPEYAPQGPEELAEWAKERLLIPWTEWAALLPLCGLDAADGGKPARYLGARLAGVLLPGAQEPAVAALECLPALARAWEFEIDAAQLFACLSTETIPGGASPSEVNSVAPLGQAIAPEARAALDRFLAGARADAAEPDAALLFAQWLRAYGPLRRDRLPALFGAAWPRIEAAVLEAIGNQILLADSFTADSDAEEICEAGNLEILLRRLRRRSRPAFQTLPAQRLPLFLAAWQGVTAPAREADGLQNALETLLGYPAPAGFFEAEIFPARLSGYQTAWLDAVMRDSDLLWFGCGRERVAFAFPEDLGLFRPEAVASTEADADGVADPSGESADSQGGNLEGDRPAMTALQHSALSALRRAAPGRLDFAGLTSALAAQGGAAGAGLTEALWGLTWQGRITNDTWAALRKGLETGFQADRPQGTSSGGAGAADQARMAPPRIGRGAFRRWQSSRPWAGSWRVLPVQPEELADALDREERTKDRVRILLRRYGILFRQLLEHELPALRWPAVFRALRLLELSGEVLTGHFFAGLPGLQFLAPQALQTLSAGLPGDAIYMISALDPASPCGLGLEGLPYGLPPRMASTHLVFHGDALALSSRRLGRDLQILVPPRSRYLAGYLGALRGLAERAFLPVKSVETETVNGEAALASPYLEDLLDAGFERGIRTVTLRRRF